MEPDWRKALIRYVLSMKGNLEILPWTASAEEFVVYRGQSGSAESKPGIPRIGSSPLEVQNLGQPISTSKYLTATILRYSWPKPGRLFKIHVKPGVKYVSIPDLVDVSFDDLSLFELDLGEGGYKTKTPAQLRGTFKDIVAKENEVLLKLNNTEFKTAAGVPETWTEPEVPLKFDMGLGKDGKPRKFHNEEGKFVTQLDITLYETYLFPKPSGRGRTFRRKARRMNKNGRRSARQPCHRRHRDT